MKQAERCDWTRDDFDDSWDTSCGEKWQFTDGGPAENHQRFCGYCGGEIFTPRSERLKAKRQRYLARRAERKLASAEPKP